MQSDRTDSTQKDGWVDRELWRAGELVGYIGANFNPDTLEWTGFYARAFKPKRVVAEHVTRSEAVAALEALGDVGPSQEQQSRTTDQQHADRLLPPVVVGGDRRTPAGREFAAGSGWRRPPVTAVPRRGASLPPVVVGGPAPMLRNSPIPDGAKI